MSGNCSLTGLPDGIGEMKSLRKLNAFGCSLESLPDRYVNSGSYCCSFPKRSCCINGSYYIFYRLVLGRRLLQKLETELYVNLMGRPKSHSANIRGEEIHFILVLCLHNSVLQEQKFECTDQLVP